MKQYFRMFGYKQNKKQLNLGLNQISNQEYQTLISSISTQLEINNTQTFYPLFNILEDLENEDNDNISQSSGDNNKFTKPIISAILNNKYNCLEIKGVIEDETDNEENDEDETKTTNARSIEKPLSNVINIICKIRKNKSKPSDHPIYQSYDQKACIKVAPLLEPLRFLENEFSLVPAPLSPNNSSIRTVSKINSNNNTSFIETSFLYYASKLVENGLCPSFPYLYGCFNGSKKIYCHEITDEYDDIVDNKWFRDKLNKDFTILKIEETDDENESSNDEGEDSSNEGDFESYSENENETKNDDDNIFNADKENDDEDVNDNEVDEDFETESKAHMNSSNILELTNIDDMINSNDEAEAESENTKGNNNDTINEHKEDELNIQSLDNDNEDLYEEDIKKTHKRYYLKLYNYPVQCSIMENMNETLDQLLDDGYNMSSTEWLGILFQISFGLAVAQKYYSFCHNDLHSSNVMFQSTKERYLYFHIHDTYYQIPTHNKIVKIIDFARATFKYAGTTFFSDVFDKNGDAEEQYDYPTDIKGKKNKKIEKPNPSFDLARFSATIKERVENIENADILNLITKWMTDENGFDISHCDDDFSLYIHIARKCHNAIPIEVLKDRMFKDFKIKCDKIPRNKYVYYF